jgi:hypothetical protein
MDPGRSKALLVVLPLCSGTEFDFFPAIGVVPTAVRFSSMKAWGGQLRCSVADHDSKASMVLRKSFSECAREIMSASNGAGGK